MKGFCKPRGTQCPSAPVDPTQNILATARSRPGAKHFVCVLVDLLPAVASLVTRPAPQMPPVGAQCQTEPGLAVPSWVHWEYARKETGMGIPTRRSLCRHRPHCARCVRCCSSSERAKAHRPGAAIMQIPWGKYNCLIPQDRQWWCKVPVFAPPLWCRSWASSQFALLPTPHTCLM